MQNKLHIKWLKNIVGKNVPIHSVIVFSDRCVLKKVEVTSPDVYVIKRNTIRETILTISNKQYIKLNNDEINTIYQKLYPYTQTDDSVKQEHIMNIHSIKKGKNTAEFKNIDVVKKQAQSRTTENSTNEDIDDKEKSEICPRCGAILVLRTAKKGKTWESNFTVVLIFQNADIRKIFSLSVLCHMGIDLKKHKYSVQAF